MNPHNLLKSRTTALVHNSFKRRDGSNRYTHIKITTGKGYFRDTINPGGDNLYTADQIYRMVEFLIDNIFVKFGRISFPSGHWDSSGNELCPPPPPPPDS